MKCRYENCPNDTATTYGPLLCVQHETEAKAKTLARIHEKAARPLSEQEEQERQWAWENLMRDEEELVHREVERGWF